MKQNKGTKGDEGGRRWSGEGEGGHLEHQQFSLDKGLVTPKFSLKRPALLKK